ncbi:MAG TPA: 3'(2'),5'-bisphosphate nucleotidase CysQ [Hyphomicrobiales bacterium]|nr:3'(2'),5'-bisphosphate nucleotidase CysQ [Hyphomicrobiales bacterium]
MLDAVVAAARAGGELALGYFQAGARHWQKEDASVVTEADLAVDRLLNERLGAIDPGAGWLSEETADTPERLGRTRVWIVDPIDGTRAFVKGLDDWVISIGLVEHGRPVMGVIFNPRRNEMFSAVAGGGALLDGIPLAVPAPAPAGRATAIGPRGPLAALEALGIARGEPVYALAYRLIQVAAGRCDAALASARARDWDLAAADLSLAEAGAELRALDGARVGYNRPVPVHGPLVAAAEPLNGVVRAALADAARAVPPPAWT